jgi:hypothetical protein
LPAQRRLYALVPRPGISGLGRYLLRRIALASGTVRDGPSFAGDRITLASGYLWIYRGPDQGQGSRPGPAVVRQVSPRTLTVLRSVTLAPPGPVTHVPSAEHGPVTFALAGALLAVRPRPRPGASGQRCWKPGVCRQ